MLIFRRLKATNSLTMSHLLSAWWRFFVNGLFQSRKSIPSSKGKGEDANSQASGQRLRRYRVIELSQREFFRISLYRLS